MAVKLSQTSKMPCKSWSLQALKTCPGSVKPGGELVDACQGCYATDGFYNMSPAKKAREFNLHDWEREEWAPEMIEAIGLDPYFRWLDSGDLYSISLAWKVADVIKNTPATEHWLPTRMGKFSKFNRVLRFIADLPNGNVRHSSDSINGGTVDYGYGTSSTIIKSIDDAQLSQFTCEAYTRGGKCGDCRACWSKKIPIVAYPAHGPKMGRVIKLRVAA